MAIISAFHRFRSCPRVKREAQLFYRYEAVSALLLREILQRENPQYASIVAALFPETREEQSRKENTTSNYGQQRRITLGAMQTQPRIQQ
ncbi:hypothetical protein Ndes2437A_g05836 [Nannochloris sp. 'desiccata']